jgi:hypothetical protein
MLLSFEIPTPHVEEFAPLEDFAFGLAHLFLKQDFPGAAQYVKTHQGCLLDNSMYELGEALSADQLMKAEELSCPMAIIAPDWMDDFEKTLAATVDLTALRPAHSPWTVGGVVQGKDYAERKKCYIEMIQLKCSPICFPFRSPREETIPGLFRDNRLKENQWYHLLGLRNLKELGWNPPGLWSCDTGKPFKNFYLNQVPDIRGHGAVKLHDTLSLSQRRIAGWNIAYMRGLTMDHARSQFMQYIQYRRKQK